MYGRSRVNVKVEPRSTFTFTRGLSYTASILFTSVNFTCVPKEKLRYSGNPTLSRPCKICLSFSHKLWPKFGNRWISRIGSLRFWWKSEKKFSRKNAGNSRISTQTPKRRGTITIYSDRQVLCYIVDWCICYPCYTSELRSK